MTTREIEQKHCCKYVETITTSKIRILEQKQRAGTIKKTVSSKMEKTVCAVTTFQRQVHYSRTSYSSIYSGPSAPPPLQDPSSSPSNSTGSLVVTFKLCRTPLPHLQTLQDPSSSPSNSTGPLSPPPLLKDP